jgi:hypothetical protein
MLIDLGPAISKDSCTNGFIAAVVGAKAVYIVDGGGIPAMVTEVWEPCGFWGRVSTSWSAGYAACAALNWRQ